VKDCCDVKAAFVRLSPWQQIARRTEGLMPFRIAPQHQRAPLPFQLGDRRQLRHEYGLIPSCLGCPAPRTTRYTISNEGRSCSCAASLSNISVSLSGKDEMVERDVWVCVMYAGIKGLGPQTAAISHQSFDLHATRSQRGPRFLRFDVARVSTLARVLSRLWYDFLCMCPGEWLQFCPATPSHAAPCG
jgi:hypothetical protein